MVWNIGGLKGREYAIREYARELNADVVVITETKIHDHTVPYDMENGLERMRVLSCVKPRSEANQQQRDNQTTTPRGAGSGGVLVWCRSPTVEFDHLEAEECGVLTFTIRRTNGKQVTRRSIQVN